MKKNRTTIIIVIVLLLVSVYFLFFRNGFSTLGGRDNNFAVQDTAAITKIVMEDKGNNKVVLTRVAKGQWKVNDHYFVRNDAINTLLYTMKMVAVKDLIDAASWDNVVKHLATTSVKVEIYDGDARVKAYYVGGPTADNMGTYMLLVKPGSDENYKQPYITYIPGFDGFLSTRYFAIEKEWRDRTILRYYPNEIKSVALTYPQAENSFSIQYAGHNRYSMENPVSHQPITGLDTMAVRQYLTYCQSLSWEIPATEPKKDSILASQPIVVIDVKDTAGKLTEVKLFNKKAPDNVLVKYGRNYKYDPDRMFALVNGKDFVIVQYFVFGKLLQTPSYFIHREGEMLKKSE